MASSFGSTSTAEDVLDGVDLSGKRVLVTGVSAGLGADTARVLAAHGAHVVGTARDLDKARAATKEAREQAADGGNLELVELDLASLASVRACADALVAAGKPFDLVIANAGVMGVPKSETKDGFETHFGTNHLGHFVLVNRIASLLKPGARLVSVTSWGHQVSDVDLDDLNFDQGPYNDQTAYGRSKTANILFAVEFDRRHKTNGVRATAVHPGGIPTELYRNMDPDVVKHLSTPPEPGVPAILPKSFSQGVAPYVWAGVVAPSDDVGGRYVEDCHVADVVPNSDTFFGVRSYAIDPDRARTFWAKSEEMVGERF